ncbi:MAG: hypothetical protein PVH92_08720 [Anaerolineales bacterium]
MEKSTAVFPNQALEDIQPHMPAAVLSPTENAEGRLIVIELLHFCITHSLSGTRWDHWATDHTRDDAWYRDRAEYTSLGSRLGFNRTVDHEAFRNVELYP